jgi:hypothetical protein
MKKWMVGYQEIYDCSVIVHARNEKEAIQKAMDNTKEAQDSYELGEPDRELWDKACADLMEE